MSMSDKPATASLPTRYGNFKVMVWPGEKGQEPVAVITQTLDINKPILVRVHSECLTGDVFGSLRCDCCDQKEAALKLIAKSGNGIFIYLRQEGRGMGLFDKIRSYKLQEEGIDTHQASIMLGHEPDSREYSWANKILKELGVKRIKLLTNNPAKVSEIFDAGFEVEKTPLVMKSNKYNSGYFETKKKKFKHVFGKEEMYHYIGVTFTDLDTNIEEILEQFRTTRTQPLLKFHLGFYIDHEILSDIASVRKGNILIERGLANPNTIPVAHYSSKDSPNVIHDIKKLKEVFPNLAHIQINDVSSEYVLALKTASKYFTFIAPLSNENFELIENPEFRNLLLKRSGFLLLDNSKGTGKNESYKAFQEKINKSLNYGLNNIALAGGFGADTLETYFKLKNYFKLDFSIDAESKLHSEGLLDSQKVSAYVNHIIHGNNS
jgi:GTP cyclohydrolase II